MCNTIFQYHTQNPARKRRVKNCRSQDEHVVSEFASTFKPRRTFGRFLWLWQSAKRWRHKNFSGNKRTTHHIFGQLVCISWYLLVGNNIHISASSSAQFTFHIPKPWLLLLLPNNNRSIHHPFHHRRNNELNIFNAFNHSPINLHKFVPSSSNVLV